MTRHAFVWMGILLLATGHGGAQEWARFRGPNGTGRGVAPDLPVTWEPDDATWMFDLDGVGHASPVLWGRRVFVTSGDPESGDQFIYCLDAERGTLLWNRRLASASRRVHQRNSQATSTPAADSLHLYVAWATPRQLNLAAIRHTDGHIAWRRKLGRFEGRHGFGTSPIVFDDLVILSKEQRSDSFLVALDSLTGETVWKCHRRPDHTSYSTPCVLSSPDRSPQLIFMSLAHGITGLDPLSGDVQWQHDAFTMRTVASPLCVRNWIVGSCGSGQGGNYVVAVQPGQPDGDRPREVFRVTRSAPYVPTSIAWDDLLFLWSDRGVVTCFDLNTHQEVWRRRVGGNFSGSPVCTNARIYCIAEDGDVVVIAAGRNFQLLARNPLGEPSRSTPAIARGKMYLRTESSLRCIGPVPGE